MTVTLDRAENRTDTEHAVQIVNVHKTFGHGKGSVTALDGVDLRVAPGELVCLLGASGCGKTTLLHLIAGLDKPTSGTIELNTSRPAVMFQEAALLPWLTAERNIELPLKLAGVSRGDRQARVTELLDLVHLSDIGRKRPHELSGGMLQRIALARALASTMNSPNRSDGTSTSGLLLMDEPFSALDAITREVMQAELLRIWNATNTTVVFVTHDVREAVRLGQRLVLLSSRPGRVVREWLVGHLDAAGEGNAVEEVNARLREVISTHAAA